MAVTYSSDKANHSRYERAFVVARHHVDPEFQINRVRRLVTDCTCNQRVKVAVATKTETRQVDIGSAGACRGPSAARRVCCPTMSNRAPVGSPARPTIQKSGGSGGRWNA
eukprot:COSAG02_NODE_19_length_53976_cov_37.338512_4_plen_110_part_00